MINKGRGEVASKVHSEGLEWGPTGYTSGAAPPATCHHTTGAAGDMIRVYYVLLLSVSGVNTLAATIM